MEQEQSRALVPDALKRIGYMLRLAGHVVFILVAVGLAVFVGVSFAFR